MDMIVDVALHIKKEHHLWLLNGYYSAISIEKKKNIG
jgi:hypothetical protein